MRRYPSRYRRACLTVIGKPDNFLEGDGHSSNALDGARSSSRRGWSIKDTFYNKARVRAGIKGWQFHARNAVIPVDWPTIGSREERRWIDQSSNSKASLLSLSSVLRLLEIVRSANSKRREARSRQSSCRDHWITGIIIFIFIFFLFPDTGEYGIAIPYTRAPLNWKVINRVPGSRCLCK